VQKPWGFERIFAHTDRYVGKVLHISQGEALSLQFHRIKDETIHVWQGELLLEIEEDGELVQKVLGPGEGARIRPGVRHRMTARLDTDVLEVSTPELDDVVRLEDRYGRASS